MIEKIICSAIWYKNLNTAHLLPININKGVVICGHHHAHCIYTIHALSDKRQAELGESVQGFLTNKNRFIDRMEALEIAIKANQLIEPVYGDELFSENIY
jgi:hypothetical protein